MSGVFFYVQHLLGIGHLRRAAIIARALRRRSLDVAFVSGGAPAGEMNLEGATLVQLYTALVFEGPGLVRRIKRDLLALLERDGFANVTEAVGADVPCLGTGPRVDDPAVRCSTGSGGGTVHRTNQPGGGPVPQDIEFDLPFTLRMSPDLEGTRRRNLRWVQRHRIPSDNRW